nr:MAG TPA: hypothetical protein [Caudoviricetes sp.]
MSLFESCFGIRTTCLVIYTTYGKTLVFVSESSIINGK